MSAAELQELAYRIAVEGVETETGPRYSTLHEQVHLAQAYLNLLATVERQREALEAILENSKPFGRNAELARAALQSPPPLKEKESSGA